MKSLLLNFLLLLLFSFHSFCQIPERDEGRILSGSNFNFYENIKIPNSLYSSDSKKTIMYDDIEGSPYIDNLTPFGKIYNSGLQFIGTVYARYNAYTDDMEVSLDKDGIDYYLVKKKPNFLYFVFNNKTYFAFEYYDNSIKTLNYFVVLYNKDQERSSLLKKEKINLQSEQNNGSGFLSPMPPRFLRQKNKFFIKINDQILEIPKKKKDFYKLFSEKKKEVETYVNSKNIKIDKEIDLIQVIAYYNSLFN